MQFRRLQKPTKRAELWVFVATNLTSRLFADGWLGYHTAMRTVPGWVLCGCIAVCPGCFPFSFDDFGWGPSFELDTSASYEPKVDVQAQSPCDDDFPFVEIEDDPTNPTTESCDTGTLKSPGADIDAAQLGAGVYLASCTLRETLECESTADHAHDAEGAPNSVGGEAKGEYVSLNGGTLRCTWAYGTSVVESDERTITIYEVGKVASVGDRYTLRVCRSDPTRCGCSDELPFIEGQSEMPISALF